MRAKWRGVLAAGAVCAVTEAGIRDPRSGLRVALRTLAFSRGDDVGELASDALMNASFFHSTERSLNAVGQLCEAQPTALPRPLR
jgi:hypothetical protein